MKSQSSPTAAALSVMPTLQAVTARLRGAFKGCVHGPPRILCGRLEIRYVGCFSSSSSSSRRKEAGGFSANR